MGQLYSTRIFIVGTFLCHPMYLAIAKPKGGFKVWTLVCKTG
jgi:hypothetical protein